MLFKIIANDVNMGKYEGADRDEAILHYVQDAGYKSVKDAAKALGKSVTAFLSEIDTQAGAA